MNRRPENRRPDPADLADLDRDLRDLFGGRRPDAERFAHGVAARLHARAAAPATAPAEPAATPLAKAASLTALDGAFVGGKALLPWLSWPVLLLASSLLGGLGAARSLRSTLRRAPTGGGRPSPRAQVGFLLATLPLPVLFAGGLWLGAPLADLLVAVLLLAMLALAMQVRFLAHHGLVQRDQVAGTALALLETLFQLSLGWIGFSELAGQDPWGGPGVGYTLLLGLVLLQRYTLPARRWLVLVYATALVCLQPPWRALHRDSAAAVAADVATVRLGSDQLVEWHALASAVEALRANGTAVALHPGLATELQQWLADGTNLHPQVLSAAFRLGLVDAAAWPTFLRRPEYSRQCDHFARSGPLHATDYDLWQLPAWLAAPGGSSAATAAERARLLARVDGLWQPQPAGKGPGMPLANAWLALRWGQLLGAPAPDEATTARIHELLLAHQAPTGAIAAGAFTDFPTAGLGGSPAATFRALDLLAAGGAPTDLDTVALHRALRQQVRHDHTIGRAVAGDGLLTRANLLTCERLLGCPSLTPGRLLVEARVLLAMLAVVLLCGYAVWQAPPERIGNGPLP